MPMNVTWNRQLPRRPVALKSRSSISVHLDAETILETGDLKPNIQSACTGKQRKDSRAPPETITPILIRAISSI